ncbi:hypothetical protein D9756_000938 [Leucocoprinus leucothites]|uniref:G domain-containing protein n=1 Tax=Leucocoprinus leucothites TaxID=201217 RepID=A0A8H5GER0_9AGAR|nr:hypothetical protein D9756_000938 [Leucoagaricus leucothites]
MRIDIRDIFPYIWSVLFGNRAEPVNSPSGITIAFVGRSGSGMSKLENSGTWCLFPEQLIHDATGLYATSVAPDDWHGGHPGEPYTDIIQSHGYTIPGVEHTDFPLVFIDTPRFDPDSSSQNDVHGALRGLCAWLKRCKPHTKLDGLIFMHDVSLDQLRNRLAFSPRENIMEKLCGSDWAPKVVFVSSHWDQISEARIKDVQAQIKAYWFVMRNYQDAPELYQYEHPGTRASAWKILQPLVGQALANRKDKLDMELLSLRDSISSDLYGRIDGIRIPSPDRGMSLVLTVGSGL